MQSLQNKIKRDPESYEDEFAMQVSTTSRRSAIDATLAVPAFREQPGAHKAQATDSIERVCFIGHVLLPCNPNQQPAAAPSSLLLQLAPHFTTVTAELPQHLMSLLEEHSNVIPSRVRRDMCRYTLPTYMLEYSHSEDRQIVTHPARDIQQIRTGQPARDR